MSANERKPHRANIDTLKCSLAETTQERIADDISDVEKTVSAATGHGLTREDKTNLTEMLMPLETALTEKMDHMDVEEKRKLFAKTPGCQ